MCILVGRLKKWINFLRAQLTVAIFRMAWSNHNYLINNKQGWLSRLLLCEERLQPPPGDQWCCRGLHSWCMTDSARARTDLVYCLPQCLSCHQTPDEVNTTNTQQYKHYKQQCPEFIIRRFTFQTCSMKLTCYAIVCIDQMIIWSQF